MDKSMVGSEKYAINTPALLIDLEKMEFNIARMAHFFKDREANLRPHMKTHKTPVIAHKQIEAGAIGITCQKLSEAEVMVEAGIKDILIANEVVGANKIKRLVNLARYTRIKVAVDNSSNVADISEAAEDKGVRVGILVEVNIGMNRCGVPPGETALRLLVSVLSRPTDNRAILDAGMKAMSTDMGLPEIAYPKGLKVNRLSEEHAFLIDLHGVTKKQLPVGAKIEMIPSHGCTTINLHDFFFGIRDGVVESTWRIEARGKFE